LPTLKTKPLLDFLISRYLLTKAAATVVAGNKQMNASTMHWVTVIIPAAEGMVANKKWRVCSFVWWIVILY